ncbi:MAG TPA: thioesterase family protein [Rhabdochlamydiaceae bacterium]|nr:thioesterase family protein [Rhabdochlamydiaceae bacterium]
MFKYKRTIRLSETDATGVIYFSELLKLGLETFEAFLADEGFTLSTMIEKTDFLMPIVHAEADFSGPLKVGDQVDIELKLARLGTSSFTLSSILFLEGKEMGKTSIVHVTVSKITRKSIPIPDLIKDLINSCYAASERGCVT